MKCSTLTILLTLTLFTFTTAAHAGNNDKNKRNHNSNKKPNLGNILPAIGSHQNPFHTLPFGKPGKPKPIGQTKPVPHMVEDLYGNSNHHGHHGNGGGNGGGPGNGTGPGTGQGNGQGNGQQHPRPEVTTRPEDLFPNGKPPKPTKPGYTWVDSQNGVPGHWERERAPQTKPGFVWVPATSTVPGHWERARAY